MKTTRFLLALTLILLGCGTMMTLAHSVVPSDSPEDAASGALGDAATGNWIGMALKIAAGITLVAGSGYAARKVLVKKPPAK